MNETAIFTSETSHLEDVTGNAVFRCRGASAQWLNPPVASDYVSDVYFS